jgi:preprotein translocase subunit SecD/preprotein translocase subunit SecF
MFMKPLFRFVPDGTRIRFMNGRFAGLIVSAILSSASIGLFFYPGLNLGLDFKGGVVIEVNTPQKADFAALRGALAKAGLTDAALQSFGSGEAAQHGVLISLESRQTAGQTQTAITEVETALASAAPGAKILSTQAIGASVSDQLFTQGLEALGLSFVMILAYIWFRFEWQFAVGAVATLVLDTTKTIGFMVITRIPFDLVTIAAILTVIGYSTNDKVVVYDRVRENLRKFKTMNLRELIDLSINETLNRTLGTSGTVFLAALPLALFGGSALSGFAWIMLFGIVVGTSSSIFIAAPILLFLGEHRLRRSSAPPKVPSDTKAAKS